jgi:hypothetical protein
MVRNCVLVLALLLVAMACVASAPQKCEAGYSYTLQVYEYVVAPNGTRYTYGPYYYTFNNWSTAVYYRNYFNAYLYQYKGWEVYFQAKIQ